MTICNTTPERAPVKLGLVLSGGGAKGAYEVGVMKALARACCKVEVISGASIGAVNGAVIAGSTDLATAAAKLEQIWTGLDNDHILNFDMELTPTRIFGLTAAHILVRTYFSNPLTMVSGMLMQRLPSLWNRLSENDKNYLSMLDHSPVENLIKSAVDFPYLCSDRAMDFYVSIFPATQHGGIIGLVRDLVRWTVSSDKSEFIQINACGVDDAAALILASAAIPLAFKPVEINNKRYYDGGMGERIKAQGNTPIEPLVKAGCTHAIVVILGQGVLWDRYEWPDITALEIRPSQPLGEGLLDSMLDFDPARIRRLIKQGEDDALHMLARVAGNIIEVNALARSRGILQQKLDKLEAFDPGYESTMAAIRSITD